MRIQKTANRNLTGKGNASLLRQKRSRKPAFVAVKAANAMRNIVAAHRFRAASFAGVLCAKRAAKSRWTDQKMNEFIFWLAFGFSSARKLSSRRSSFRRILFVFPDDLRFFLCPEALLATLKLQAQIVCYCVQAASPTGFFAAFFPGKKARILPAACCLAGNL